MQNKLNELLQYLIDAQPNWVAVQRKPENRIEILAQPPIEESGLLCREYNLALTAKASTVSVNEIGSDKKLPTACPCRHLNDDGSFCLGFNGGIKIDSQSANDWWEHLSQFLQFQEVAEKSKIWPPYIDKYGKVFPELSHGVAAEYQLKAEKYSKKLGFDEKYAYTLIERKPISNWLPINKTRNHNQKSPLKNGRLPCPFGCKKKGQPILRRNCCKNDILKKFLEAEADRQVEAKKFVENYGANNCNLDMRYCEFKDRKNPHP